MWIITIWNHESLSESPTADDVVLFMKNSQSDDDWNDRIDEVKAKFGGSYPSFWYEKIIAPWVRYNKQDKAADIKVITFEDFKKTLNPIEEIGKKEDVESNIDDLQKNIIYDRPTKMPFLMDWYKFICWYDQWLWEKFFVCNTLEWAQALYDKYAQWRAINISRYTWKIKKE